MLPGTYIQLALVDPVQRDIASVLSRGSSSLPAEKNHSV